MPRRSLIEALERLPRTLYRGRVYRHMAPSYDPMNGEGARVHGGRWNPPGDDSFPVLYTAPDKEVVLAEVSKHAVRFGVTPVDLLPRKLVTYEVELQRVLDLSDPASVEALGLTPEMLVGNDPTLPRAIGDAAHYVGFEGVLARSAAADGQALALFHHALAPGSVIKVLSVEMLKTLPT